MSADVLVLINAFAYGGSGIGEVISGPYSGLKVFVPFVSPGEVVKVSLRKIKKRYAFGDVVEVVETTPERQEPLCAHFTQCGGCELQHISYSAELLYKEEMVRSSFEKGGIPLSTSRLEPTVGGNPYRYRRRLKVHLHKDGSFGYYRRGSNSLISIQECPIALGVLEKALQQLLIKRPPPGYTGSLMLESDGTKVVASCKITSGSLDSLDPLRHFLRNHFAAFRILSPQGEVAVEGDTSLRLSLQAGFSNVPAGAFSQGNWEINSSLVSYVLGCLSTIPSGGRVADLFGGAGNFGLEAAHRGYQVISVELSKKLSQYAHEQAHQAGLGERFISVQSDVGTFLRETSESFDAVIADPPREGLKEILPYLHHTPLLIAVFCELPSAVRDIKTLVSQGWKMERLKLFDMFPRTSRVELVSLLRKEL